MFTITSKKKKLISSIIIKTTDNLLYLCGVFLGICREMILSFKFSRANLAEWLRRQFQVLVVTGKGSNPLVRRSYLLVDSSFVDKLE